MNSETHEASGEGLLAAIAIAIIIVVLAETAFIAFASWWALPGIVLGVIAAAIAVVYAVVHAIES
jgi:hypothetical protein